MLLKASLENVRLWFIDDGIELVDELIKQYQTMHKMNLHENRR